MPFFFPLQSSFTQGQIYRRNMSLKLIGRVFSKSSDIRSNKLTLLSLLVSFYQVRYRDEGLKDSICDKKRCVWIPGTGEGWKTKEEACKT